MPGNGLSTGDLVGESWGRPGQKNPGPQPWPKPEPPAGGRIRAGQKVQNE